MKSKETPPFAPTLMESTRAIGYSLEAAIADIVDNSIAAKSGKVQISFFPILMPNVGHKILKTILCLHSFTGFHFHERR